MNYNSYLRLLARNEKTLNSIKNNNRRLECLRTAIKEDMENTPATATAKYKAAKWTAFEDIEYLLSTHKTFKDSIKTQKMIDSLLQEQKTFLDKFKHLGV